MLAGACAVYHTCCHNFLHARQATVLQGLQKSVFFLLRLQQYAETGVFPRRKCELLPRLSAAERALLAPDAALDDLSAALLDWAGGIIARNAHEN